jgi:hypothetical protein
MKAPWNLDREISVHGDSWADVLSLTTDAIARLWEPIAPDRWNAAKRSADPESAVDVFVTDSSYSLWLGDVPLGTVDR